MYSAFLAGSIVENKLDTADTDSRDWRSTEAVLQQAVSELKQVANVPKAFGTALALGPETERLACKVLTLLVLNKSAIGNLMLRTRML